MAIVKQFEPYKEDPIALYGLGIETEKALKTLGSEFRIAGLLDSFREDGSLYGKPVIPLRSLPEYGVKLIIVVARPGSCRAITKRIASFCEKQGIALMDIRGRNLLVSRKAVYRLDCADGITKERLARIAGAYDVVSFDLFDTLITRRVLTPDDMIELTDMALRRRGVEIDDFCKKRIWCEKELSKAAAPKLLEIYQFMTERFSISAISAAELAQLEWETDFNLLLPRFEMVEFLHWLHRRGKAAYIVSDTYYTNAQLAAVLKKCGISEYSGLLASCEYRTGKTQKLFDHLKEIIGEKRCLHIGDDLVSDIESAQKHGLDARQIFSGIEFMERTAYLGLGEEPDEMASRVKLGMLASNLFNSPFQFERGGRIGADSAYDIGYLFFAPIITDFMGWFDEKARADGTANIWFGARDGALIKRLYGILHPDNHSVYFLTSRTAAIRAGTENDGDIEYVAGMRYSGPLSKQLAERFGISAEPPEGASLSDYKAEILERAKSSRRNYLTYINGLEIQRGGILFFDFVAKGTTQFFLSRLVENPIKGLYFLQLEKENMAGRGLVIETFYDTDDKEPAIYDDYYILEPVLSSSMPPVVDFDEGGRPCYARETRSDDDIRSFQAAQDGILEYFHIYYSIIPNLYDGIDRKLDEDLLGLIHKLELRDGAFLGQKVEDPFFNRSTDMTDLI